MKTQARCQMHIASHHHNRHNSRSQIRQMWQHVRTLSVVLHPQQGVHLLLASLLSALCSLLSALYPLTPAPYLLLSALYPLLSTLRSLLSPLCSLLCPLCSVLSALSSLLSPLCSLESNVWTALGHLNLKGPHPLLTLSFHSPSLPPHRSSS